MGKIYEKCEAKTVAFIGLGTMGYPMAGHLAQAGHRVTVYNRTGAKAQKWVTEYTGKAAATPMTSEVCFWVKRAPLPA